MATYYIRDCGHETLKDMWKSGANVSLSGLCAECKTGRIGETIEFVRYGKPPASGVSRNHREDVAEEGVSVYELKSGQPDYVGFYFGSAQRPAYAGKGRIVGWGSDGEPLIEINTIRRSKKFDHKAA